MMQQKVNDSEKRTRDEDRCREYQKQAIGFRDEVSPSLHFGDHTRTIKEKEISNDETCNQEDYMSFDQVEYLKSKINFLQQKLQTLSVPEEVVKDESLIPMKLLKIARQRLRFDCDDVYSSIRSWDYFFKLYSITSDRDQFFAIEQLLPANIQRLLSVYSGVKPSYFWLVSFLKERYDPKFVCYEMDLKCADENTDITELECLAYEAAKCPQEHLIKHFMLESCTKSQRQKMKQFLLSPMKDFKFQLKLLLTEDCDRQMHDAVEQQSSVKSKEKSDTHFIQSISNQHTTSESVRPKSEPRKIALKEQKCVKHFGTFSCSGCNRRWISHSLSCTVGESVAQVTRQCFNCMRQVSAQNLQVVRPVRFEESHNQHRRVCYRCGLPGHIVRDCENNLNVEIDEGNSFKRNFGLLHSTSGAQNISFGRYGQRGV